MWSCVWTLCHFSVSLCLYQRHRRFLQPYRKSWLSGGVNFFKIILAILGPLHFHYNRLVSLHTHPHAHTPPRFYLGASWICRSTWGKLKAQSCRLPQALRALWDSVSVVFLFSQLRFAFSVYKSRTSFIIFLNIDVCRCCHMSYWCFWFQFPVVFC